jgi:hypothetical protein
MVSRYSYLLYEVKNANCRKLEKRYEKRLSRYKGKHLSIRGRLTLINSWFK